jgi:hypothetical protein
MFRRLGSRPDRQQAGAATRPVTYAASARRGERSKSIPISDSALDYLKLIFIIEKRRNTLLPAGQRIIFFPINCGAYGVPQTFS